MKKFVLSAAIVFAASAVIAAQQQSTAQQPPSPAQQPAPATQKPRPPSPPGAAAAHVGYEVTKTDTRTSIKGGNWIEITYSRPLKRGRDLWTGETFGQDLYSGAPVWRAGANVSTRLKTDVPLEIGGTRIPGTAEYSLFIEFKGPTDWTLIVSSYGAKTSGRDDTPDTLWGSFGYKPDKDMVRVPMKVTKLPFKMEQLTWAFTDMTTDGGNIMLLWDDVAASVPFKVAK